MSMIPSWMVLYYINFVCIWLFYSMMIVVASWKRCRWEYMSIMVPYSLPLTFSTINMKLWRVHSSILVFWSFSSKSLLLSSFSSFYWHNIWMFSKLSFMNVESIVVVSMVFSLTSHITRSCVMTKIGITFINGIVFIYFHTIIHVLLS